MAPIKVNIVLFGIGNVGSTFIKQVIEKQQPLLEEKNIELVFPVITNSTLAFFEKEGQKNKWETNFTKSTIPYSMEDIIDYAKEQKLENLIAVDATLSVDMLSYYELLIRNHFNILSVNTQGSVQQKLLYAKINKSLQKAHLRCITPANLLENLLQIATSITRPGRQSA